MSFAFSFSSLKQYETCPRAFSEVRIYKRVPREETEQSLYGTAAHAAAEAYAMHGAALPPAFEFLKPILDTLLAKKGTKYCEYEMALDAALDPCDWKAKQVWVRGIADFLVVDNPGRLAWCVDYKFGNDKYADTDQLDLMSLLIFRDFPAVLQVRGALLFVLKGRMVKHTVRREDQDRLWQQYRERVAKIDGAIASGTWNPQQSGLCRRHCNVLSCEMNGRH